jgi:hypothetical protein
VTTTAFITHSLKSSPQPDSGLGWAAWLRRCVGLLALWCALLCNSVRADTVVELHNLKVVRASDGVYLSADWQFELPTHLEDALLKGVPLYFVTEIEINQERWYFYDKRIAAAERHVRVVYQPLTRRWRVSVQPQAFSAAGLGVSLGQSYATLDEAMQVVRHVTSWRIAQVADVNPEAKQTIALKFKLDLAQLPRPLQMGVLTQTEWNINHTKTQRLTVETER